MPKTNYSCCPYLDQNLYTWSDVNPRPSNMLPASSSSAVLSPHNDWYLEECVLRH